MSGENPDTRGAAIAQKLTRVRELALSRASDLASDDRT
jgi:hypothetical protein